MSLYRTELRRLGKRRITRVMLVLLVLGIAAIVAGISLSSQRIGPAQRAAAEARAEADFRQAVAMHEASVRDCEAAEARGEPVTERFPPNCGRDMAPTPEYFTADGALPYQFVFRDEFGPSLSILAGLLTLVAFVVGASFVGAEWHSGAMMNLLLWRPKRLTVLLTKLAALLSAVLGTGLLLGGLWTAAFWLIGRYDGRTGPMTRGAWESFGLTGLRGIVLALVVATVAFGLASLGRHTALALGVAVGGVVLSEIGLRIILNLVGTPFADRYVLSTYLVAWFDKSVRLVDWRSCEFTMGECRAPELVVTWQSSAVLFGVATVLVLGAALWAMRRRDVT